MKHFGGTQFWNLIGNNWNPDQNRTDCSVKELRQISNPYQKVNMGWDRRFKTNELGIVTGIKDNEVVYSC